MAALVAAAAWLASGRGEAAGRLTEVLEDSFERADLAEVGRAAGIIAIGGSPHRIREAGRLARQFPQLRVLVSGAGSEADVLGLLGPGIEPGRVQVEARATTTHENAAFSAALLRAKPGERWVLVTSAAHMPRAVGAFRKQALSIAPWPVYDRRPGGDNALAIARHEWLGLVAYWLLGRTSELLPAPTARAGAEAPHTITGSD